VIGLRIVGALTASTSSARRRSHPQPSRRTELSTERDGEVRILLPLLFAETCVTLDQLGRALINAQPQADAGELDESEVVGGELVVSGRDAATLLDLVKEPLH
jgi:hypothetical protein